MAAHQHMKRNKEDELDKIGLTRADLFTDIISTSAWIKWMDYDMPCNVR